jgi:hypothetical protein
VLFGMDDDNGEVIFYMNEDEDDDDLVQLAGKKSNSSMRKEKLALSLFRDFLIHINHEEFPTIDHIPEEFLKDCTKIRELIGLFPDFLIKKKGFKTQEYLLATVGKVKSYLAYKFPRENSWCEETWYRNFRSQIYREAEENGLHPAKESDKMTTDEIEDLCRELVGQNTSDGFRNRSLLVFTWQAVGRITEVVSMEYPDFTLIDETR